MTAQLRSDVVISAARTMAATGMVIVEVPSGRILFKNEVTDQIFGKPSDEANPFAHYDTVVAFDASGRMLRREEWPIPRAIRGEVVTGERMDVVVGSGTRRTLIVNASPLRDASGQITAAVSTYFDATQAEHARDRMRRLQELTAALSHAVEKQHVVSIFVDAGCRAMGAALGLAWLLRGEDTLELVAGGYGPLPNLDRFRAFSLDAPLPACDAVRSGKPLLFENLAALATAYPAAVNPGTPHRSWAIMPLVARGRSIGAASFSFASERSFSDDDRELLAAIAGQASLALERSLLLDAERCAREDAERAHLREHRLRVLAERLSSALTREQIATIACEETASVLGGHGSAATLRIGDQVKMLGTSARTGPRILAEHQWFPLDAATPASDAIRTGQLVWCSTYAELSTRYAALDSVWRERGIRSLCAVPFSFEGSTMGALAVSFADERELRDHDRLFLDAVGQLVAQALERARLFEAHRTSEDQLRSALFAARAATWSLDLATMKVQRDESYAALVGAKSAEINSAFMSVHPEDREIAREALARTLAEGIPYEPCVRIQRDDGSYMWIQAHGRPTLDAHGKPTGLSGVIVDIDEVRRASARVEEERRINETLYRLAGSFARELDQDRLIRLIIDEIKKLVGAEHGEYLDHPALENGSPASSFSVQIVASSGESFGSLRFSHSKPDQFTEHHHRLAASITNQAAVALENARLYSTIRVQNEQLERAVERARAADRRKDEFLAMLGHELRNPLAPITTALDLLDLRGSDVAVKERGVIRRQVTHLSRLIDDLLDVSRITRGKISLSRQVLELAGVVDKAVEMASPLLEQRMQHLTVDVPRENLRVDADPTRLAQVFANLLMNASKYSDPGSKISVTTSITRGQISVAVRDEGMGISPELLPRLFDLFVQGERTIDRAAGGLGIGLTIAKSLCELHDGTITVASGGTGKGSTFTVTLPMAAQDAKTATQRTSRLVAASTGTRVLVVDDNVDAADMLRDYLASLGHELAIAHDGPAAIELAMKFKPDIAVLDIGLPVMSGYEVARRLREAGLAKLRLIAVTGYGQSSDRMRAREVGFDHHLVKPIKLDTLAGLLAKQT